MFNLAQDLWWAIGIAFSIFLTLGIAFVTSILLYQRRLIFAQKEKMEAIRKSEAQYSDLFNNVTDVVFVHSLDGKILQINAALTHCLGYRPDEVIGKSLHYLVNTNYKSDVNKYLHSVREKGETTGRLRLSGKDNINGTFEFRNTFLRKNGKIVAVRGIARDVTDQIAAEQALRESEERFRLLTDFSPLPIAVQIKSRWVYVNSAGVEMVGARSIKDILGKSITAFIRKEQRKAFIAKIRESSHKQNKVSYIEQTIYCLDGKPREIEIVASSIVYGGKNAGQVIIRDITAQKKLQRDIVRTQRLETAGKVAGQIAHDFNNLLAPLTAYPTLLRDDLPKGHKSFELVNEMETAAKRIAEINQQLLALGRRGHYEMEPVDLNRLIDELLKTKSLTNGIVVEKELEPALLLIKAGPAQLSRALLNLIHNASEAMQGIGVLRITTGNVYVEQPGDYDSTIPQGEYVKLVIADSGPGIEASVLDRMFDPFFTTKKMDRTSGSGLGLSIVHGIVEDHDGYIVVKSTLGHGTNFSLFFPVFRIATVPEIIANEVLTGNGESILIVDDDPVQRRVTEHLLTRLGYCTTSLACGEDAVEFVKHRQQDLIILDMVMGGIDGADTYRLIAESNPGQKAIVLSGYEQSVRIDEALRLGVGEFVQKPVLPKILATALRSVLNNHNHNNSKKSLPDGE